MLVQAYEAGVSQSASMYKLGGSTLEGIVANLKNMREQPASIEEQDKAGPIHPKALETANKVKSLLAERGIDPSALRIAVDAPPGTGKTVLSRALAQELGMKHFGLDWLPHNTRNQVLGGGHIEKMPRAPRAGEVVEHYNLLRAYDPEVFDAAIHISKNPEVIRKQVLERGRSAGVTGFMDYGKTNRIGDLAFHTLGGEPIDLGNNTFMKLRPKEGWGAERLDEMLKAKGIDPGKMSRHEKLLSLDKGKSQSGSGWVPYVKWPGRDKEARVKTPLQPHQQRVIDRITAEDQPGLVVAHGLGSGKTLTSIAAQEALGLPSDVVVPAALQANYGKERKKHLTGASPAAHIQSMQNLARKGTGTTNPLLIVDEAHRAREPGSKTQAALQKSEATKRLLLTGSPFYNHPADIAPLVNLVANNDILPADREAFAQRYITNEQVSPGFIRRLMGVQPGERQMLNQQRAPELKKVFNKWVDYHGGSKANFPDVEYQDVPVQMTPSQLQVYDSIMKGGPRWLDYKIKSRLPPSKREAKSLNNFLSGVRQISNTTAPFQTGQAEDPKIQRAFTDLQKTLAENERAKAVVYSNFLEGGIKPYRERLQAAGIPFGEFTGQQNQTERDQMVRDYNANKLRALLLSSAGGEGLDLKGTRLLQILEPHWNEEKLHQVEGRGARYMSHADLPPEERKLLVQRYLSTRPRSGLLERARLKQPGGSVDEYLQQLSNDKARLIDQFRGLMAQQQPVAAAG